MIYNNEKYSEIGGFEEGFNWTYFLSPSPDKLIELQNSKLEALGVGGEYLGVDTSKPLSIWLNYKITISVKVTNYQRTELTGTTKHRRDKYDFYIFSPWDSIKNAQNQVTEFVKEELKDSEDEVDGEVFGVKYEWGFEKIERIPTQNLDKY